MAQLKDLVPAGAAPPPASPAGGIRASEGFRRFVDRWFPRLCWLALAMPILILGVLFADVVLDGAPRLGWDFLTSFPSRKAAQAGVYPALIGSLCLMVLTAVINIPLGIAAAIYLEEYSKPGRIKDVIEINISNLAGVPSIIYGLLGLELFVRALRMERSLIAGACTLGMMLLPTVIMASREALRTVPRSVWEASLALGAGRWRTLRRVVLPMCFPGLLTGVILALARAIGETAPLITIGALSYVGFLPESLSSPFTALPIQIFNWISRPQIEFHQNAAAGIVVLLVAMLVMNGAAIWLRARHQKQIYW